MVTLRTLSNAVLVALLAGGVGASAPCAAPAPVGDQPGSFGSKSVAAALADLHSRSAVEFTQENGWTIAADAASQTLWSFAPAGNPAYPSVVRRQVVQVGEQISVKTNVLCEAAKRDCDDLVRSFEQLNSKAAGQLSSH
jgi:hypothetical protein